MHREEKEFSIVLNVAAEFAEDYEGDADGYQWFERFESVLKPRLVAAVFDALRSDPEFRVTHAPRGRDPERVLEIEVLRRV
ncbi:MAG TPA: hypothetical protein VFQ35_20200 [Polyangiaceae bacterium]|nr:hypothetical protein [Polyangiaceae bacterium]